MDETHLNQMGTLHGGLTATLVDSVSTLAIACAEKPPGVSVDMNITLVEFSLLHPMRTELLHMVLVWHLSGKHNEILEVE